MGATIGSRFGGRVHVRVLRVLFVGVLAFTAFETGATFAVMVIGGLLASLLAVWLALRTPPQLALGG